jgi:hypothetical protein
LYNIAGTKLQTQLLLLISIWIKSLFAGFNETGGLGHFFSKKKKSIWIKYSGLRKENELCACNIIVASPQLNNPVT